MLPKFLNVFKPGAVSHLEREICGRRRAEGPTGGGGHHLRHGRRLTFVIGEASAELLERSSVAHGPERTVELIIGHHQVLGVPRHVDDLKYKRGHHKSTDSPTGRCRGTSSKVELQLLFDPH